MARIIILLLLFGGLVFGSYYGYNKYYLSPVRVLAKASEQTVKLQTVHADMDISVTAHATDKNGTPVTQDSKVTGFSDLNLPDKTQKAHMTIAAAGHSLDIDMVLLKGGVMYMKMPIIGQDWISINTQTLKDQGNLPVDPQSNDYATQSLGFLKSLNKDSIIKLDDEEVDGIKSAHFRVDVSTPQYLEYIKQLPNSSSLLDEFKNATVKTDVWMDKKTNYVVKMESTMKNLTLTDKKTGSSIGSADGVVKITYSKFNQPVDISKPEGNIITYEDLLKKLIPQIATPSSVPTTQTQATPTKPAGLGYTNQDVNQLVGDLNQGDKDYQVMQSDYVGHSAYNQKVVNLYVSYITQRKSIAQQLLNKMGKGEALNQADFDAWGNYKAIGAGENYLIGVLQNGNGGF